jgi:large subunit ribosomal protein L30
MAKSFEVTLMKSPIGCSHSQRRTILAVGLRKRHQTVTMLDNPANRGQISKIQHLVEVKVQR